MPRPPMTDRRVRYPDDVRRLYSAFRWSRPLPPTRPIWITQEQIEGRIEAMRAGTDYCTECGRST